MDPILIAAISFITLALIFYSIGVWSEKLMGTLKTWHVLVFYLGLICDTLGTSFMSKIAGGFSLSAHSITGVLAIFLMFVHALWATIVIIKDNPQAKQKFHKFSVIVWTIWLIPYILGMILGMS